VPVAVIVTVGAGALMMLTGRANEMLAVRGNTGSLPPSASATPGTSVFAGNSGEALAGYPGEHGAVTVGSMWSASGVSLAVGTADGHPAIWRRAANGSWTLVSAATLGTLPGTGGLASVAHGPAGWIAVGAASEGGATAPVVLTSSDGLTWRPAATLEALAGAGTQFLGVAAGDGGYVVVGRQMNGGRTFAVLWRSADLRQWAMADNGGLDGRVLASTANAVVATADGFIAVGSHGAVQSVWTSPDGLNWTLRNVPAPSGADSATLSLVAATGTRVVAAGYAATAAGDIPVAVVSADGGATWQQTVLPATGGAGAITALTTTAIPAGGNKFVAAGLVGPHGAQRPVTWTSPDGQTWSQPAQTGTSEITALTPTGTTVTGTAQRGTTPAALTIQTT